ncbi:MAG: DNA polymerase IV, partial [Candidatus Omnitrophica bacterium]|nr:DNA polymerase IV [Candidatus Omnitrophota bacterium]
IDLVTLASYPKAILHVDCDAFFTSCEEAQNPRLRGKPLVTGQERGIVSCASYEAKKRGVKRPMRLGEARKACPGLIVLPSDYELYSIYSERMFSIIRRFSPQVEEYSIDEAFCDVTGLRRIYRGSYENIALTIKETIQKELGITVSVGLSLSKILAKICSKQNKPNGFCAVPGYKLHEFLNDIPLERVCGFGPSSVALLTKYGISSVLAYIRKDEHFAKKLLGKIGLELWQELRGIPVYAVSSQRKDTYLTISKSKTFMPASRDRDFVKAQLVRNLESAFIKLRRYSLSVKRLTVFLRRNDFTVRGLEVAINRHSSSTLDFTGICGQLFEQLFERKVLYRTTGVVLSDLVREGIDDRTLFDDPIKLERTRKISQVADTINKMYGKHTIHVAASLPPVPLDNYIKVRGVPHFKKMLKETGHAVSQKGKHPRNCGSWRKQELLPGETFRKRLGIPLLTLKKCI